MGSETEITAPPIFYYTEMSINTLTTPISVNQYYFIES